MKKHSSSTDARTPRYSFRHSFSLTSLLGSRSRSPEGTRRILNRAQNDSKNSFVLAGLSSKLATEPVRAEDFADSDSSIGSQYSDEEVRTAESIYSVIREYEPHRLSFWFNEEFDRSDESYQTTDGHAEITHPSSLPYSTPEEEPSSFVQHPILQAGALAPGNRLPMLKQMALRNFRGPNPTHSMGDQVAGRLPDPDVSPSVGNSSIGTFTYASPQVLDSVEEHEHSAHSKDTTNTTNTTSILLSSGELLSRLDGNAQDSTRNSVSSELALQTLIAGVDLDTELPVMVYSVHDQQNPLARWSVYEKHPPASPTPTFSPRLPPAIPVQMRDGTSLRRVSVSSRSNLSASRNWSPRLMVTAPSVSRTHSLAGSPYAKTRARHSAHRSSTGLYAAANSTSSSRSTTYSTTSGSGSNNTSSSPGVFSNISGPIPENPPLVHSGKSLGPKNTPKKPTLEPIDYTEKHVSGPGPRNKPYIASPPPSVTRESGERRRYHESMFYDEEKHGGGIHAQQPRSLTMSWAKWICMMVVALVAVPVFFLIPLGAFDHGGFSRASDRQVAFPEKAVLMNWRYQRKYTKVQKLASLLLGLAWISVVLAMIAVGFGVGLHRPQT